MNRCIVAAAVIVIVHSTLPVPFLAKENGGNETSFTFCRQLLIQHQIEVFKNWGSASEHDQLLWNQHDCNENVFQTRCHRLMQEYDVVPFCSWGNLRAEKQEAWLTMDCNSKIGMDPLYFVSTQEGLFSHVAQLQQLWNVARMVSGRLSNFAQPM